MNPGQPGAQGASRPQQPLELEGDCSHAIIGAAVEVQRVLGTGLLPGAYAAALAIELAERELGFQREVPLAGRYKGKEIGTAFLADFLVEQSVVVQVRAVDALTEAHRAELLSQLRLAGLQLGLLINFQAFPVVKGIQRVVNKL